MAADERGGDFGYAEAAQNVEHQRDLRLFGETGMAAGKHHAQLIVLDGLRREDFLDRRRERPFAFKQAAEFGREGARGALAAEDVERAVFRRGHEPRRGVLGHASEFPDLERAAEGVLHDVFCQREVMDSEDARKRGDHAPRFAPKEMVAGFHHMFICKTGRTSTAPSNSKIGQPLESSTAWSRSRASIME